MSAISQMGSQGASMQSQCSQDSFFASPLSLSLSKFSYATIHEESNAPIPWVHLSSKGNLLAVFEKCRVQNHQGQLHDQSRFRVTNGTEVMEDLNLVTLAVEARKANQVSNVLHRPSTVTIIVKKPCLAVRYPSGRGQIRRFQIRFLHDTDYYAAMGRFSEADVPVIEAGTFPIPQPQPRPISSSSTIICPSDAASHQDANPPSTPPVLQSNQISTTAFTVLNGAEAFSRPATSDSSVTHKVTPLHRNPQTILTGNHNQDGVYALPQDTTERGSVGSYNGTTTGREAVLPPRQTSNQTSDVKYLANQTHTPSIVWSAPVPTSGHAPINLYAPRPSTAPAIESQGLTDMLPPKRELPFGRPVSKDGVKLSATAKSTAEALFSAFKPKVNNDHGSSSALSSHVQELETQSAPPKPKPKRAPAKKAPARVTKKSAASRSRKKAASDRVMSPVPSVEELLKRSQDSAKDAVSMLKTIDTQALLAQVEERQANAGKESQGNNPVLAADRSRPTTIVDHKNKRPIPFAPLEQIGQSMNMSSLEGPMPQAGTVTPVFEVLDSQDGGPSQSQAVPTSGQVAPPDGSTTVLIPPAVGRVLSERPQNLVTTRSEPSTQPLAGPLEGPLASLMQDPDFATSPNLAQWAERSEEDRRASLETFICRSIQDENFFNLCKDLSGTWQRVFFGKNV